MFKKKLEVVELNKKKEQILLEEESNPLILFLRKHRFLILLTLLILSLSIIALGISLLIKNMDINADPDIKSVSVDTTLDELNSYINSNKILTSSSAIDSFYKNSVFKNKGEVIVERTVESSLFTIKYLSDGTVLKINKNNDQVTRIAALSDGSYAIDDEGVINSKAELSSIKVTKTEKFDWGEVSYYSDGSALITNEEIELFVRDATDITSNYISDNKVSYLKETKQEGNITLNYYYDGTIQIINNGQTYIVRNESDIKISSGSITYPNNNAYTIKETKTMNDGTIIEYYKDGGAIIKDGKNTISVRKSNSIIIKDNNIYEIVDNIYVTESNSLNNGNIIYYTNGGAYIKNDSKEYYISDNSLLHYENNSLKEIPSSAEELSDDKTINNTNIKTFIKTSIVKNDNYTAIVPSDGVVYNTDGSLKEIVSNDISDDSTTFNITNNTNEELKYRVVIEKSNDSTNLKEEYIRYQLQAGTYYSGIKKLSDNIWEQDDLYKNLKVKNTDYILLDETLYPYESIDIKLMLWTDYDTIPNSMQNKYFYGTIKVYSWKEVNN